MKLKLFRHEARQRTEDTRAVYAWFELIYTATDFAAALFFVLGSVFFFYDSLMDAGTWCFLIGSVFFALKPSLKLTREIKLYRMGREETLAERVEERRGTGGSSGD